MTDTGHPFAHLTMPQRNLLIAFIQIPHPEFKFDTINWKIRSIDGIVEPDDDGLEDWIEFTSCINYHSMVTSLGATELTTWNNAKRIGLRLLDMGPETLNEALSDRIYYIFNEQVNWGRDGF